MLTQQHILAIQKVITLNKDITNLLKSKGVSVDDLNELFKLLTWPSKVTAKAKKDFRPVIKSFLDGKEPDDVKVELILYWVVGVIENASRYGWLERVSSK